MQLLTETNGFYMVGAVGSLRKGVNFKNRFHFPREGRQRSGLIIGGIFSSRKGVRRSHHRHVRDQGFLDGATEFGSQASVVREHGKQKVKTRHFWRLL